MGRSFSGYSIHKKTYPGMYNFKDDADGDEPAGWTPNNGADCTTVIRDAQSDHRKVLELDDQSAVARTEISQIFTAGAQTNRTIEFWWETSDITKATYFQIKDGATRGVYLAIQASKFQYNDGGFQDSGAVPINNVPSHHRVDFDCATDTFDWYIDGVLIVDGGGFENAVADLDRILIRTINLTIGYKSYISAVGYSWDTDYKIGDNSHWRHYKESTDSFEEEDVGTQGTSITWVDAVNAADDHEIVQEFNEHKKVLRTYRNSGSGDCYHVFATQSTVGWAAGWVKVSDANALNNIFLLREDVNIRVWVRIDNDRFEYDAGAGMLDAGVVAVDATQYYVYVRWYADNTFDLWVDNVQYLDGVSTFADFTGSGVNRWYIDQDTVGAKYIDIDAPMSSLDGDVRGDNRILEYHTYTKTDITDYVSSAIKTSEFYNPFQFEFIANKDFYFDEVFFQFYDVNDKLAFEGEMKNRIQDGALRSYPCRDKCWDEYQEPINQAFSTKKIHDPTDSTSMLKVALSTVGQVDGDLILVNADTKTDTYSPTLKNYPTGGFLRDLADIADSNIIRYADGRIDLDDDLTSGITLDLDTAAHKALMTSPPILNNIMESFNYFEIFGAINPDTGERYGKIIDNSGTDKKHKYRYVNNNLRNQTDVDAYAIKIAARLVTALQITQSIQNLGALELGTTINYKYVDTNADINIPQADYFIIKEILYLHDNKSRLTFSEGVIESSKYANYYEKALENTNVFASEIYETDRIIIQPEIFPITGATKQFGAITLDAVDERAYIRFYTESNIDSERDIIITWTFVRGDANNDTIDIDLLWDMNLCDGSGDNDAGGDLNALAPACAAGHNETVIQTIAASDIVANGEYNIYLNMDEVAREMHVRTASVQYHQKRSIS